MTKDHVSRQSLTRRQMIEIAAMGTVAAAAGRSRAFGQAPKGTRPNLAGKATPASSVFLKCNAANTSDQDSYNKFHDGDSTIVFPTVALWLVMLTEEWDDCLNKDDWFNALVQELIDTNKHLTAAEITAFKKGAFILRDKLNATKDQWHNVRSYFNKMVRDASSAYGKRPCPGAGTVLDIAALTPTCRPPCAKAAKQAIHSGDRP